MLDQIRFFAGAARSLGGLSTGEFVHGYTSMMRREPIGVCAQVTPWNYPMMMAVWKWAPALAAGNTVVLKPSDTTPVTTVHMGQIMAEILPPGVFNVLCGDRDTGRVLVAEPIPAVVSVTGSVRAGREVAASAAADLKRVHLELGGKAPVIVFADSGLEASAEGISAAGYLNAGQDCTAATRVLVESDCYEAFLDLLVERAQRTRFGPPDESGVEYGPLNNLTQLERVERLVASTPGHAKVLTGGKRADGKRGYYFEPTIIAGLRQDDELIQTEIFGPVITVQPFSDERAAITMANDVEFGLGASIWTTNHQRAMRISRALEFGTVWINCHLINPAEMPNAGFKHSGDGTDLSLLGLENYTRLKHVMSALD
jgi:betaine-aldehyde dehydrogenase